jgi:site-specific DNA recombinase
MPQPTSSGPLRAALYIRVSSEEQAKEGYSLIAQQEKLEEYARKNGCALEGDYLYIDDGYTGKNEHRPQLTRLFQDAERKTFEVVLVYRLDRFFRNVRLLLESVERLGQGGVGLKSITEPFDTSTPIGRYVLTNLGAVAELERAIILERKELGTAKAAQAGKWMGGTPPYGYTINRETKKLEIVPEEAEVVRMVYEWLIEEKQTLSQIQKRINAQKVPTKNDLLHRKKPTESRGWWRKATLGRFFTNEIYAGTFWFRKWKNPSRARVPANLRPKEDWVAIPTPAILTPERQEAARRRLKENRRNSPRRMALTYLFSKRLRCGLCGASMTAQSRQYKNRRERYYSCHKSWRQHAPVRCPQRLIAERRIEGPVWDTLARLLLQPEATLKELDDRRKEADPRPALREKQAQTERELERLEAKREKLLELYLEEAISKSAFVSRSREVDRDRATLVQRRQELAQRLAGEEDRSRLAQSIRERYDELGASVENADYETKRRMIQLLVERIVAREDRLEITCHLPHSSLEDAQAIPVALRPDRRVDCDAKQHFAFSVEPLPRRPVLLLSRDELSSVRRKQNLKFRLKRNLFHRDGRLKARLGGKPKGTYTLERHLARFRCPVARERFLTVRGMLLESGLYREECRKRYLIYVDPARFNRFHLFAQRRDFWIAVKGDVLRISGLRRGRCDGIQTFFKATAETPLERLREVIETYGYRKDPLPSPVAATSSVGVSESP